MSFALAWYSYQYTFVVLVRLLFDFVPVKNNDATFDGTTWKDCWDGNIQQAQQS